jgi:tetratricopeptide (TPR) repeat protein
MWYKYLGQVTMLNKINISPQRKILIVYIVLAVVTVAVFWQVHQYDFINFDDDVYVTQNSNIQSGITLDGFRWAFSTTHAEFWHPLTWISLMLDYQLFGLNAGGYHLTNLILHIISALLLFWIFNRMTGSIWRSAFIAGLFAIHPLRVESVAWIAERKDVLSAFFWMLTLCLYVYYTEKPAIRRYLLVLFSFVCGLMSKSMVVTLPVVMILLDYWPLGRLQSQKIGANLTDVVLVSTNQGSKKTKSKKGTLKKNISPPHDQELSETKIAGIFPLWQLREKIPFFILSAVFSILTYYAQHKPSIKDYPFSLGSRIANAPVSFVTYLEKTFWPHNLAVVYPFSDQLPAWQVMSATLLIIIISAAVIAMVKRLPYLFTGWLWYVITILPVIGIIQVGDPMADRYIYLPSIGIAIMLAWGIPSFIKSEEIRKKILFPAGIAVFAILAVLTWQQCGYWKNSITLFNHALQVTKDNYLAHNARGVIYAKFGQYQQAIEDFNETIRLQADYANAYYNRGLAYIELSQYQRAIGDFNETIRLQPVYADSYYNRGNAYTELGQYQRAFENYNEVIRLNPNYAEAYNNRGVVYFMQGNKNLGCRDAQKACELGKCKILEMAKGKGDCR